MKTTTDNGTTTIATTSTYLTQPGTWCWLSEEVYEASMNRISVTRSDSGICARWEFSSIHII